MHGHISCPVHEGRPMKSHWKETGGWLNGCVRRLIPVSRSVYLPHLRIYLGLDLGVGEVPELKSQDC